MIFVILAVIIGLPLSFALVERSYMAERYGYAGGGLEDRPEMTRVDYERIKLDCAVADGEGRKLSGRWWNKGEQEPVSGGYYYFGG